jgi:hypothetical protein
MDYYIQIKYGTIEHDIERARRKNFMEILDIGRQISYLWFSEKDLVLKKT